MNYNGEAMTIEWGSGIEGDESISEACLDAICNQLGSVCARQVLKEGLAALVNDSPQGKTDDGDDDPDDADKALTLTKTNSLPKRLNSSMISSLNLETFFLNPCPPTVIYEPHQCIFHLKIPLIDLMTPPYID